MCRFFRYRNGQSSVAGSTDVSRRCTRAGLGSCDWLNAVTRSGHDRIGGQRRQTRSGQHHAEIGARFVDVHARLGIERGRGDVGEPVHEPRLTKVVVDDEQTVRREPFADGAERLFGEHVALEPHAGEARLHRQRVDEREDDEVVLLVGRPQEVSRVVVDSRDTRIGVRPIRMVREAEPHDHRIDLDGVHVRGAMVQRPRRRPCRIRRRGRARSGTCRRTPCTATGRSTPCDRPAPSTGERCCSPRRPCRGPPGRR